ncbi:MAG TPA: pantetheine-phosphate adenylyltransferase [Actinomycetales bacterium]|nr:pantetheine-phosphate adenylyltransferase [Actinomycetales bacterium]
MKSLAVCPGSYDPITLGHLDVVRRVLTISETVLIAVAHNPAKRYLFSLEERVELAQRSVAELGLERVQVEPVEGLLADYVRERGATAIVKGLRGSGDFESERTMALLNRHMSGVETLFVMGDQGLNHVASSFVKEMAEFGADVTGLVTNVVREALAAAYGGGETWA